MGQQFAVSFSCDWGGEDIPDGQEVTRSFRIDGKDYETDLCAVHSAMLDEVIALRARRKARSPRPYAQRLIDAKIRAWAKASGIEVADKGRLPGHVIARYEREQAR